MRLYLWTSDNEASRRLNVVDGVTIQVLFRNHFLCEKEENGGGRRE